MELPTTTELPIGFDPNTYDSIPYQRHDIFDTETSSPSLESLARVRIRECLEKKLGSPIVSRDTLNSRHGLRKLGFTQDDILSGKVKVR